MPAASTIQVRLRLNSYVSMGLTAEATVLSPLDTFINSLVIRTHNFKLIDDKRRLACLLYLGLSHLNAVAC